MGEAKHRVLTDNYDDFRTVWTPLEKHVHEWSYSKKKFGQAYGPVKSTGQDVLSVLIWIYRDLILAGEFPKISEIAKAARCAHSTASNQLKVLKDNGFIDLISTEDGNPSNAIDRYENH